MRHRRTRDIVIELTSLLDVVMILIFAVMIENAKLTQEAQNNLGDATAQVEVLQQQNDELVASAEELQELIDELSTGDKKELAQELQTNKNLLKSYQYMDDIVLVINISLENRAGKRCLSFGSGSDADSYKVYEINKTDSTSWADAVNQLKIYINDTISNEISQSETSESTPPDNSSFKNDNSKNDNSKFGYLIFSLNDTKVYMNDYNDIQKALMSIAGKNDKIFYYPNIINGEEN